MTMRLVVTLTFLCASAALPASPALAQDIRGLEVCTAEKDINRRTSCLQANTEFLQQALARQKRDGDKRAAAADAEIAALKERLTTLAAELDKLKAKPVDKPTPATPDKK